MTSTESIREQQQAKVFLNKPSAKKASEILNLSRNQLRILAGFLMGHFHLERRLFKLGLSLSANTQAGI